jgi:hypothetical protein
MKSATIMALSLALCSCSTAKHNSDLIDSVADTVNPQLPPLWEPPEKVKEEPHQVYLNQYHQYYKEYKKQGYTDEQAQRAASIDTYYGDNAPTEPTSGQKKVTPKETVNSGLEKLKAHSAS